MSDFSTLVTSMPGLTGYWPLEAGSGTDASAGGHNMTLNGTYTINAAPLISGGGNATTFDGSTGWATSPAFSVAKPYTVFGWFRLTNLPTSPGSNLICGYNSAEGLWVKPNATVYDSNIPANHVSGERVVAGKTYFLASTYDGNEMQLYINGRWSRNNLKGTMSLPANNAFSVARAGSGFYLPGAVGHVGIFNRALGSGEIRQLFLAGNSGAAATFTDIFDLTHDGIAATGTVDISGGFPASGVGYPLSSGSPRPSLTVPISGHPVIMAHPGSIIGYCASGFCGGAIRSNESYVTLANGQPIHVACKTIEYTGSPQPIIANVANPTTAQYRQMFTRLSKDLLVVKAMKNAGEGTTHDEKGHYLSINERDNTSGTSTTAPSGMFADYDTYQPGLGQWHQYAASAVTAATLHRFYNLPKYSWTRNYAESVIDFSIAQLQRPDGGFADDGNNDFFWPCFGMILMLLAPWMDSSKIQTWKDSIVALGDHQLGNGPHTGSYGSGFYCINGNRNLQNMWGVWMNYLITGDAKWKRAFDLQYNLFLGGMPAIGSFAAPPAAGTIKNVPAPTVPGDWPTGANTNVWNGQSPHGPPSVPYGFYITTVPTAADGSDGVGYLAEAHPAEPPGFDQNYSGYQLEILNGMLPWLNYDPRFVYMTNMVFNNLWPYIDQTGGQILWAANNTAGHAEGDPTNNTPWAVDIQGGTRQYNYAYNPASGAYMHTLYSRNLRSSYPQITAPAPAYSQYGPITAAHCKDLLTVVESSWSIGEMAASRTLPVYWRNLGKYVPGFLLNDPAMNIPTVLGQ